MHLHLQADQAVSAKRDKKVVGRSACERLETRVRRLEALRDSDGVDIDETVRAALAQVHRAGKQPDTIRIRRGFVCHTNPASDPVSDRRLPPREQRPPLARLISPRGLALRTQLTALFVAQCARNQPGRRPTVRLPVEARESTQLGWADLIAAVAEHDPDAVRAINRADNRLRQLKAALDTLAQPGLGLVSLPRAGSARTKYEDFDLRDENGAREVGPAVEYLVPRPTEPVVSVPSIFFLNGWIHTLTDSEIAAWLMFRDFSAMDVPEDQRAGVHLSGDDRVRYYVLSKDTWENHRMLTRFGLIRVEPAAGRRADGTVEDYDRNEPPLRHRFWVTDVALQQQALPAVLAGVAAVIDDGCDHDPRSRSMIR